MKIKLILTSLIAVNSYALSIAPTISTLGIGLEVKQNITENLSIKLNANKINIDVPFKNTQFNFNMSSYGLLLSYNIWQNLALDTGVYITNGRLLQNNNYSVEYMSITGNATNTLKYDLSGTNPYLGISYTSNNSKGFFIGGQLGIIVIKTLQTNCYTYGYTVPSGGGYTLIGNNPDVSSYIPYPVIGFNLGYNF